MIRTYSTIFFALVSMASMGQELTLKGVPVSQLTSQYVEVYVFESSMKLRTFDIVIDAGQIEEFADVFAKKNSPTGHNAQLLNPLLPFTPPLLYLSKFEIQMCPW